MNSFPESEPAASGLHAAWYSANSAAAAVTAQRCGNGHWRHPARYRCAVCQSDRWSFVALAGSAVVESWTVTRRPLHVAFAEAVPYAIVVAQSDEGPRLFVQLRTATPGAVAIGDAISLAVDRFGVPYAVAAEGLSAARSDAT